MNAQAKFDNVNDMIEEAETTIRKGLGSFSEWGEQARDILENKPAVVLAAAGISGFIAGALVRHSVAMHRSARSGKPVGSGALSVISKQDLPVDPAILLAGGVLAGVIAGPLLIQQLLWGLRGLNQDDNRGNLESTHLSPASSMNEKPFEKY